MPWSILRSVGVVACVLALCACAVASVDDIVKDREGYLERTFTPESLSSGERAVFGAAGRPTLPFRTLVVHSDVLVHMTDPNTADISDLHETIEIRIANVGDGYTRTTVETFNHGIPAYLDMNIGYLDLLALRDQSFTYGAHRPTPVDRWDRIMRVDPGFVRPEEGKTYEADEERSGESTRFACESGKYEQASVLEARLPGRALELSCVTSIDGVVNEKSTDIYLEAYGVYLIGERDQANASYTFKITDVAAI